MGEGFERERGTCLEREAAAGLRQLFKDDRVNLRRGDDRHVSEILRGGADHRGAADVDLLDGLFERDALAGDGLLEGVEVDDDYVDGADLVLRERARVVGVVADGEDAAVDVWMERL